MNIYEAANFKVLNWTIPLYVFLIIFIVVALICLGLFLFFIFKKSKRIHSEYGNIDTKELKRLENFESERNNFEMEIAKVKKIIRQKK
jgi:integral membrane protein (TIGR04561 family)